MQKYIQYQADKVLICPLNWGLGHATRCVPIIQAYVDAGSEVVIVADAYPLLFLQKEFPQLRFIDYPSYPIRYSKRKSQVGAMLRFLPSLLHGIVKEHRWLSTLLDNEAFDMVISDNRFGLWHKQVKSVYITHQVMVKMPKCLQALEYFGYCLHRFIIEKYDTCWIPDYENDGGLSGDLSHKYPRPKNAQYIGPLSRFKTYDNIAPDVSYKNLVILSGVEPQRSIFEQEMIDRFSTSAAPTLILQGKPNTEPVSIKQGNLIIKSHVDSEEFAALLKGCEAIYCRSGYSSIMDLDALQVLNKVQFYPTPGQTEQEYLARYMKQKFSAR